MCVDKFDRNNLLKETYPYICVDASAGTGKTTIMIKKLFHALKNKRLEYYQKALLITFTNFATNQIREKIKELSFRDEYRMFYENDWEKNIQVQTNNGFALSEIIRPFLRDAFGNEYPQAKNIKQDFSDEFKFRTFKEGIKQLKETGILGTYFQNTNDFSFELANRILQKSKNAQKYIRIKFPIAFLDEYQDTDPTMHNFFMYLKDTFNISLFIVGDLKQAIYGFRGADKDIFENLLKQQDFKHYQLKENFRSHKSIQSYVNLLIRKKAPHEDKSFSNRVVLLNQCNIYHDRILRKFKNHKIAILTKTNKEGRKKEEILKQFGFTFMVEPPLNSSYPNYRILMPFLKLYHNKNLGNDYSEFEVVDELGLTTNGRNIKIIKSIYKYMKRRNQNAFSFIANLTEINIENKEIRLFNDSLDKKYQEIFSVIPPKRQIMTIHGAKGLEFDIVYIDATSFYFQEKFQEENHYVAITRPRKMLIINLNNNLYRIKLRELGAFEYFKIYSEDTSLKLTKYAINQ